ncbi:MAG: phosphoserine phosphatase SerB [Pseudomonadota bacterium]
MTEKTPIGSQTVIAVAPAHIGFQSLGDKVTELSAAAELETRSTLRRIGGEHKWAAIELDVTLGETSADEARQILERGLAGLGDVALIPSAARRKKLLISDMDSTIIEQECLDELAGYAGLKDEIAAITARAMAGELDFEGALTERVGKLAGLSLSALDKCFSERISLMPGALTLTATMQAHGAYCLLVSGGFTYFTSRVADQAGFHDHRGNTLIDDGEVLTGAVGQPILGREAKLDALVAAANHQSIGHQDVIAMGDGANDLAMIQAAGLGVAVHAKPIVAAASDAAIKITDLTAALYFQGFSDSEIVWRD